MNDQIVAMLIDEMIEGVYFVDKTRKITSWNKGAEKITGYLAEEVVNKHCYNNILNHVDENGVALCFNGCPLHASMADGQKREARVFLQHKDGHRVPVYVKALPIFDEADATKTVGSFELFIEIKSEDQFRSILDKYQKESSQDHLTEIPNRRYMNAIIESKIREYKAVGVSFGIAFIDIDNFKRINDTFGHDVGDEALKLLVKTVSGALRSHDYIGRWGGEEFIVVFSDINPEGLAKASEKLRILVEASSLHIPSHDDLKFTISLGSTLIKESDTVDTMVDRADNLMYQSKVSGKNLITIG
jgi:diguanylate cyclase (GGDEF)-like protein/PAS domain S-box-containing protein